MTVVERIRSLAKKQGRSLSYLCKQMNVARVYFIDVEKNGRDIPMDKLETIANILNVSVDYLLGKEDAISNVEYIPGKDNRVTVVGRDGTVIQEELPDDKIELIKLIISQHQKEKK